MSYNNYLDHKAIDLQPLRELLATQTSVSDLPFAETVDAQVAI